MAAHNKVTRYNLPGAGPGRPKGSPNKTTALLKDAILKAAEKAGNGDIANYLQMQANTNPGPFMALLGKVLPLQLEHSGELVTIYVARLPQPISDVDEWQKQSEETLK
jgi:hypothetical protein